ncbi:MULTISPECIES: phage tail protein [unclassified Pseudomonas]|uniref:phage tail protein n=1 Tax=unclassified Pseudomonas TaxID=196821 RepID=UPI002447AFDC|nr:MULTISPECIES: phage tail protein [unclassified Pseudomonas]MDH0894342.1 phage tail protein [Pseudomonas sp. GD03875]MDH1063363.1 phage tail protein [Pseudomonas sp. GD03985]
MEIINLETRTAWQEHEFRAAHPNMIFPPELPPELLADLGFALVEYDPEPHLAPGEQLEPGELRIEQGRAIRGWSVIPAPLPTVEQLCRAVDDAADAARKAVAGDPLRAVEYDRAAAEAREFAAAGYPVDAVPRTVSAWAISGRTPQQAADEIIAEADAYTDAFYRLREARLAAKEHIRALAAVGNLQQASAVAEQTIAAIAAAVAGIGNAGGAQ